MSRSLAAFYSAPKLHRGCVQEGACVLKVPCFTIRENTERPETVEVGANAVAGVEPEGILRSALMMIERKRDWPNPFGSRDAAKRIVKVSGDIPA